MTGETAMKTIPLTLSAALLLGGAQIALADAPRGAHGPMQGAQLEQMFERLDADGDGAISRAEIDAAPAARFAEADANGDGKVTVDEIAAMMRAQADARAARMLSLRDADGDGALSADEMGPRRADRADRMFSRLDADGDGAITRAEAQAAMQERRGDRDGRRRDHDGGGWMRYWMDDDRS